MKQCLGYVANGIGFLAFHMSWALLGMKLQVVVEKLVGLKKLKPLSIGVLWQYGMQSQSPMDPHLYVCGGIASDPRFQGTKVFFNITGMN